MIMKWRIKFHVIIGDETRYFLKDKFKTNSMKGRKYISENDTPFCFSYFVDNKSCPWHLDKFTFRFFLLSFHEI